MNGFVHLHVHTEYSLLDGACKIKKMFPMLKEMGQTAVAMTDHGNMYGTIKFYKTAKEAGMKPIIGCEVYTAARTRFDKIREFDSNYGHLVLLCKDNVGYANLIEMVSLSNLEGFYYKPRVDLELLKKYSKGLIALSACIAGDVPQKILNGDLKGATELALEYNNIFGSGNYYLEIQDHGIPEQKIINEGILKISKETGIPIVATNDAHYLKKNNAKAQKVLVCVQIQKTINEDSGMGFSTDEFYLKSEDEMRNLFEYVPEALDNTVKIAEMCNVTMPAIDDPKNKVYILPDFKWTDGLTHKDYLRKVTYEGFDKRYKKEQQTIELLARLEYELKIIADMGFVDYFLIVWDFIKFAKDNGIPIGPGRGSGAGSIVAYSMKITNIEPIRYNLLFERFLNPERISMPDFDIDICTERRGEVIEYVKNKYGNDKVAQIVTFGTMKAKAAVHDVARVLGFAHTEANMIAKLIPDKMTMKEAIEAVPKLRDMSDHDPKIKELLDMSETIENSPRHASVHAAGVVITEQPVYKYSPLSVNEGLAVTQFDMKIIEEIGLVKMDFLGLRNLTVIEDACKLIRKKIPNFIIEDINFEDKAVYEMLSQGKTDGVFQLESGGMKQTLMSLKPKTIEDIIAVISLYRPGPMDSIPTYIYNSMHTDQIKYKHPLLEDILNITHGCMVYQEQVMQIVRKLAGYSYGRADLVRRAMGKKQADVMKQEREYFVHGKLKSDGTEECCGAIKNGVSEEAANDIFDEMVKFAEYAFNKSHAAAYAFVSYYTAYLKCHHLKEYMAALLTSVIEKTDKMVNYINECRRQNVKVLTPDINESEVYFSVYGENIRFGLIAVKNVGKNVITDVVIERENNGKFKDFYNFCERMIGRSDIDSRTVESLIRCGAFDSFGNSRRQLEIAFPEIRKNLQQYIKEQKEGQFSLFGEAEDLNIKYIYPDVEEFSQKEKLIHEKEVTGLYLSDHPMKDYADMAEKEGLPTIGMINAEDSEYENNSKVSIMGILSKVTKKMTKNDTMMGILALQDLTGTIEVLLFSKAYEKYSHILVEDKIVVVTGKINIKEDFERERSGASDEDAPEERNETAKIICNEIIEVNSPIALTASKPIDNFNKRLIITFTKNDVSSLDECIRILQSHSGKYEVFFNFTEKGKQARFVGNNVDLSEVMIEKLSRIIDKYKINIRSV